jgi:hypothetical protein
VVEKDRDEMPEGEATDPADAVTLLSEMVDALDDVAKTVRDAAIAFRGLDRGDASLGSEQASERAGDRGMAKDQARCKMAQRLYPCGSG